MFRQLGRTLSFFRKYIQFYLVLYNKPQKIAFLPPYGNPLYKLKLFNILIKYSKNYNAVDLFSLNLHSRENFKIITLEKKKQTNLSRREKISHNDESSSLDVLNGTP